MFTLEESATQIECRFAENDPAALASFRELCQEPALLKLALSLVDLSGSQPGSKVLQALCIGVLIGIQSERSR
jgi:hypothetical protein